MRMRPRRVSAATEHYLVDYASNTVLSRGDADEPVPPASLKLMTAYVAVRGARGRQDRLDDKEALGQQEGVANRPVSKC